MCLLAFTDTNHPDNTREVIKRLFDRNHGRMIETMCALLRELTVFTLTWQNSQANSGATFGSTGPNGGNHTSGASATVNTSANNANASSTTKKMGAHYETRIAQARYRNIVEPNSQLSTTAAFESGSDVPSSEDGDGSEIDDDDRGMHDFAARGMAPAAPDSDEEEEYGSGSNLADVGREIEKDMSKIIRQNLRKLQAIQADVGADADAAASAQREEDQLASSLYFTKVTLAACFCFF